MLKLPNIDMIWFVNLILIVTIQASVGVEEGTVTVPCSKKHANDRQIEISNSKCNKPKPVLVTLHQQSFEWVTPRLVWVNRCAGTCEFIGGDCTPTKMVTRQIPVRVFDSRTNKEHCATYPVEEHVACLCCENVSKVCPFTGHNPDP